MKKIFLSLFLTISFSASAQIFKLSEYPQKLDLNLCQENHNIILDKFIAQTDAQAARVLRIVEDQTRYYDSEFRIKLFKALLSELMLKRIIFQELKNSFNENSLQKFYSDKRNHNSPYLRVDSMQFELDKKINVTLDKIVNTNLKGVLESNISDLKNDLVQGTLEEILSKNSRKIGIEIFSNFVAGKTGRIVAKSMFKTALQSLGTKLFTSTAEGILVDALTFMLSSYHLPSESLWTDMLKEYPELIIVPEWMEKGGIKAAPWPTHCHAIQRQTKIMEKRLQTILNIDQERFQSRVANFRSMKEIDFKMESRPQYSAPLDNTYVERPKVEIRYSKSKGN